MATLVGKIFSDSGLIKKIVFLLFGLLIFRIIASIPLPGIDLEALRALVAGSQIFGVLNLFSGGGLSNFSLATLGVFPYITVAIGMQLLTVAIPRLHSLYNDEGEAGRRKFGQYTRVITVPLALLNAAGLLLFFRSQGLFIDITTPEFLLNIVLIASGAILAMWIGELITEYGIGNGISFIVFIAIIINIPTLLNQLILSYTPADIPIYIAGVIGLFILIMIIVWVNEGNRPIPISYARYGSHIQGSGRAETYLPIKVNPSGVLPIIFALVLVAFFQYMAIFSSASSVEFIARAGDAVQAFLGNGYFYSIPVFLLVVFFTYFHTPIVFNTEKVAKNIQKQGAFIPGIRPGEETKKYLSGVLSNLTFYAAIFLSLVTVIPFLITGISNPFAFAIGGTGLLIIVSVGLDLVRRVEARIVGK